MGLSEVLEASYATRILIYLLREGPSNKTTIQAGIRASPRAIIDRTDELLQAGLIMKTVEIRGIRKARAQVYSLTPPGKQVAELLAEADNIVTRAKKFPQVKA